MKGRYKKQMDTYVALDLEMTGLKPKEDKIIEIGAVLVEAGEIRDTFSTLINPGRALASEITELTGITDAALRDAPRIEEILTELSEFIGGRNLLGHGIWFDYAFLKRAFVNGGMTFEKHGMDTLKLSRKFLPDLPSRRLQALCAHYGIVQQAHRALEDARAAHFLYLKLRDQFYTEEDFCFRPLICRVKRECPAGRRQIDRLLSLMQRHKLPIERDVESMSRNEVSRLTDQILAKYGR